MTKAEKLDKAVKDFSALSEDKQDYVLGILQALAFAGNEREEKAETANSGVKRHAD
jgi:hypothetical protein